MIVSMVTIYHPLHQIDVLLQHHVNSLCLHWQPQELISTLLPGGGNIKSVGISIEVSDHFDNFIVYWFSPLLYCASMNSDPGDVSMFSSSTQFYCIPNRCTPW